MQTRWARLARGSVTALFSVFVAALSHLVAGGGLAGVSGTALAIAFAIPVSVALTGATLSLGRLTAAVFASQAMFHALFSVGGTFGDTATVAHSAGATAHHAVEVAAPILSHSTASHSGWVMLAAHIVAAVITVIALRRGEVQFWSLLTIAVGCLVSTLTHTPGQRVVALDSRASTIPAAQTVRHSPLTVVIGRMRHRGPPLFAPAV